jgi:SNF2 family DNA or RNA helicase
LLTGTPVQNNLHELWALLNFIFPKLFHSATSFDELFDVKSGHAAQEELSKFHTVPLTYTILFTHTSPCLQVLKPFTLRRLKKDVEKHLPDKTETKLYVGLTAMQQRYYKVNSPPIF